MLKTSKNSLNTSQLRQLKDFGKDMAALGVNFIVYDTELNIILNFNGEKFISDYEAMVACAKNVFDSEPGTIYSFGKFNQVLACDILSNGRPGAVVIIDCGTTSHVQQEPLFVRQIMKVFLNGFNGEIKNVQQIELISNELAQTYEELMLL